MIYSRALKHCTTTKCIFSPEMQFFFTRKMEIVEKSKYPHSIQVSADSFAQVSGIRRQLCPGIRYPQTAFSKYPQVSVVYGYFDHLRPPPPLTSPRAVMPNKMYFLYRYNTIF